MNRADELRDEERCIAVKRGKRCGNRRMVGLTVCRMHGGSTEAAKRKSEQAKIVSKMQKFVTPIPADHELNDPIQGFEYEYRRTMGRIMWYDEQLAQLSEEELTWGKSKEEEVGSGEFPGTDVTFEARANMLHELQFRERQHLVNMQKIWIGAKLDERKLAIQRDYVRALDTVIVRTLKALGHDTNDPAIRQVVRDQLLSLPVRGAIEA